jgi:membrane protein DedA with SNARE-associated domain
MVQILHQYGLSFILVVVFAESLGLPVPSYPVILIASALAPSLHLRVAAVFAISALAASAGDGIWYMLGRSRGRPILRRLCSLSLSPDSCVQQTERIFQRYGIKSLFVSKFVPGLATVAPSLSGMLKIPPLRFAGADFAGISLWAGSAVALGLIFRTEVERALEWLTAFGQTGALILALAAIGWLIYKVVERQRFYRLLERSRITPQELKERLDRGEPIAIVDLRSDLSYHVDAAKVAGAIWIPPQELEARFSEIPSDRPVVMYCT